MRSLRRWQKQKTKSVVDECASRPNSCKSRGSPRIAGRVWDDYLAAARFRGSSGENITQERDHVRDAERLLQADRIIAVASAPGAFEQITGHINHKRLLHSRSFEDAAGRVAAVHGEAASGKMQIAEKRVITGAAEESESIFGGRGGVHPQAAGSKAFLKKHAETLFIVENQDGAAFEKICRRPN